MSVQSLNQMASLAPQAPGVLIETDAGKLYLFSSEPKTGSARATLVIEAGCGCSQLVYARLQQALSRGLRVCSYDRAGLGWSEASREPRDAQHIATQLHKLLIGANITGPIILIGHSIASFYLRVFIRKYPDQVIGLVLLDPSHPKQKTVLSGTGFSVAGRIKQYLMAGYAAVGLAKLLPPRWALKTNTLHQLPTLIQDQLLSQFSLPQPFLTPLLESDAFDQSAAQAEASGQLDDLPLLIVSASGSDLQPLPAGWSEHQQQWLALHRDLLALSTDSQQIIIEDAGHCTLVTQQYFVDQLVVAINQFVDRVV